MSLIEEALRKQEQEEGSRSQPSACATPAAPAQGTPQTSRSPLFKTPLASPAVMARSFIHPDIVRQRKLTAMVLVGLGIMALLLTGMATLIFRSVNRTGMAPAGITPATTPATPPEPAANRAFIASAAAAITTAVATAPIATTATVSATVASAIADTVPAAQAAPVPVVAPVSVSVPVAAPPPSPPAPPAPPVVTWPAIVIKGVFSAGGKTQVLLDDGVTLEAGATAPNGVQLLEAAPAKIRVSYQGQVRTYSRNGKSFVANTNESCIVSLPIVQ